MNRIGMSWRLVLICLLAAQVGSTTAAPPLWGTLRPGAYPVGFKSFWRLDFTRRYNMTFDDKTTYAPGKAPRPILVNIWYPAKANADAQAMRHGEYLAIQSDDPRLARFAGKLVDYDREVIAHETLGRSIKEMFDREKAVLQQFLDTPTACTRDAPAADGPFPIVIYHSGHGSSFEDNSVLCEYLASHGYVVLGSAFQVPSGASFNVDGSFESARDIRYLIGLARELPNADWNHVGVVGHSGGAHAALTYGAENGCLADAIVSLDTTEDYHPVTDPRWEPLTSIVTKNRANMVRPLLMVANPHAFFELADSLSAARRYYFTIKDLDHNDFISQGVVGRELRHRLERLNPPKVGPPEEDAEDDSGSAAIRSAYEALCEYVCRFFDAELKADPAAKDFLQTRYRDTKLAGTAPHVVYVPKGRTGPEAYPENSPQPPTPRQLRPVLQRLGRDKTIALLQHFHRDAAAEPIYHPVFGLALVGELLSRNQSQDAIAFNKLYGEFGTPPSKLLLGWGKVYARMNRKDWARDYFKKVLILDPSSVEAAGRLKELGEP